MQTLSTFPNFRFSLSEVFLYNSGTWKYASSNAFPEYHNLDIPEFSAEKKTICAVNYMCKSLIHFSSR